MNSVLFSGAAFGVVLGASLLPLRRERATGTVTLSLLLIAASLAAISIALQHQPASPVPALLLELIEIGLGFCAGPMLLIFCRRKDPAASGSPARVALHFVPAAAIVALMLTGRRSAIPIELMMGHQIAYTMLAGVWVLRRRRRTGSVDLAANTVCAFAVAVHLAQIVRLSFHSVSALRDIVPTTLVTGLMVVALLAVRRTLSRSLHPDAGRYRRSQLGERRAEDLIVHVRATMEQARPWLDPGLSLGRLADACALTPHQLSQLLNECLSTSFHEYVASWRLVEARRRLADPASDVFTIEAIAIASGFPSRSTFYSSFRRAFGTTPTRFRADSKRDRSTASV